MKMIHMLVVVLGVAAQQPAGLTVDAAKREILVPCKIAPRKLPNLQEIYPIEVIASHPAPQGQKAHETVVTFLVKPIEVHKALEGLGLAPGKPARGDDAVASGPVLEVLLEIPVKGGSTKRRVPVESVLVDKKTGRPLPSLTWHFTGSVIKQPDPAKPDKIYAADASGTLVGIFPVTDELVVQSSLSMREEGMIKLETAKDLLPAEGTAAVLVLKPATAGAVKPPAAAVPARVAAEAAVLGFSSLIPLTPVKPVRVDAPAAASSGTGQVLLRRDVTAGQAVPEDARPVALPAPAPPREIPPAK
jgi:hypothetical protein